MKHHYAYALSTTPQYTPSDSEKSQSEDGSSDSDIEIEVVNDMDEPYKIL